MRRLFSVISLVATCAYGQSWDWVQTIGLGGNNYIWDVVSDSQGNLISTGRVKFQVKFGLGTAGIISDGVGAETDAFLMKTNNDGDVLWARRMGDVNPDWGRSVAVDQFDNIYAVGDFVNIAVFENDTIYGFDNGSSNPNLQARSGYIAKYDPDGNLIWVNKFQGAAHCRAYGVDTDELGNSYVTGFITGVTQFDDITIGENNTKQFGFIAKYNPNGVCIWAHYIQSPYGSLGNDVKVINNQLIALTGSFKSQMTFDGQSFPGVSPSWGDFFLAQIDSAGGLIWNKTGIGSYDNAGNDIVIDGNNNIYVAGHFSQSINFGTTSLTSMGIGSTTAEINGNHDSFLAKYTFNGNLIWVKQIGNQLLCHFDAITLLDDTRVIIGGYTADSIFFSNPADTIIVNNGYVTTAVIAYDSTGTHLWNRKVTPVGVAPDNALRALCIDHNKNLFAGGYYDQTGTWDGTSIQADAGYDAYLAKIFPPLEPAIAGDTVICISDTLIVTALGYGSPLSYNWTAQNSTIISDVNDSLIISPNALGTDTIQCIVTNGYETDTALFFVYVNDGLTINLGADDVFCDGDSVILIAGNSDYSYDWGSGFSLGDSSMTVYAGGEYSVQVMNSNGCLGADTLSLILSDCLGISENQEGVFQVMPNPFNNVLHFQFENSGFEGPVIFYVYSITGEIVFEMENPSENGSVDLSDLNTGIYFCVIASSSQNTNLVKVVKLD